MLTKQEKNDLIRKIQAYFRPKVPMVLAISAGITATIFICSLVFLAPAAALFFMSQMGAGLSLGLGIQPFLYRSTDMLCCIGLLSIVAGIASLLFPPLGLAMLGLAVSFVVAIIGVFTWGVVAGYVKGLDEMKKRSSNDNSTRQMSELFSLDNDFEKSANNSFNDERSVTRPKADPCLPVVGNANRSLSILKIDRLKNDNKRAQPTITEDNGVPLRRHSF